MRTLVAAGLAMVLALAGCSGDDEVPPTQPTAQAGGAENAPTASAAPTSAGDGSIAGGVDPYCDAAREGYLAQLDLLAATDAGGVEADLEEGAGAVDVVNAAGERMLEAIAVVKDRWTAARAQIDGQAWSDADSAVSNDAADEAFADVLHYVDAYAGPEANILATVDSLEAYNEAMTALVADPDAAASVSEGAAALGTVISYTRERCGSLPDS
ncbi:hypothetical protein [Demequina sp. NBRC 110051]|uniref:hypothetical protein n=1 Tax=Demequina sp. NBRC 110051 TaxID=1570340 RepID=UPI000A036E6D|nr:hypothetical protein [Demequina sp. NBRC 110051]